MYLKPPPKYTSYLYVFSPKVIMLHVQLSRKHPKSLGLVSEFSHQSEGCLVTLRTLLYNIAGGGKGYSKSLPFLQLYPYENHITHNQDIIYLATLSTQRKTHHIYNCPRPLFPQSVSANIFLQPGGSKWMMFWNIHRRIHIIADH